MEQKKIDLQEYEVAMNQDLTCEKGDCDGKADGTKQKCKFKPDIQELEANTFKEIVCEYYKQKYSALLSPHSLWNYHSYFQTIKYNQRQYGKYLKRNISVFDEAHSIDELIIKFVMIEIIQKHVNECGIRIEDYDLSDIDIIIKLLEDIEMSYALQIRDIKQSRAFQRNPDYGRIVGLEHSYEKIAGARIEISSNQENFVVNDPIFKNGEFKSIAIKPLDVSGYIKKFFITPFQIFLSATIDRDSFCQNMGFSPDDTAFVDTPHSPFPVENRKIEFLNTARLGYYVPQVHENRIWIKIDEILSKHKGQRGLILTSSNSRCKDIINNLSAKNKRRVRICHAKNPGGMTQNDVIKEHAKSDDGVLLSSSLWQGVDLKDDLSRFQIVAKVPYPNYTEKWIKAKMEMYPLWYPSKTIIKLLQGFGRSIRDGQDWAVTYVLDSAAQTLLNNAKNLVPRAYHDALGWTELEWN